MSYTKNIAVIKGIKDGFSVDGGALSGLVKAEKYGAKLRVEVSLINFAPLTEGKYVCAISDGKTTLVVEDGVFEGESEVNTENGFAALICYVKGQVFPIASAVCGNNHDITLKLKAEIEREENIKAVQTAQEERFAERESKQQKEERAAAVIYEDEAIAEENYYEYAETFKDGGALRADKKEEKSRHTLRGDEAAFSTVKEGKNGAKRAESAAYSGGNGNFDRINPLARGGIFYEKMKDEIDKILSKYPQEAPLEDMIEESKWVRISYGEGGFYVFGVLYSGGKPKYICYGVPTKQSETPPQSMEGLASFLPASPEDTKNGYWVMYQDAETGASIKVNTM
ncbi:MAG: hypothetical protein K2K38_02805 [Clostridia bacterium]|nr:hypothetical protein [Clostridia bacterium]